MAIGKKLAKAREGIDREHLYTLTEAVTRSGQLFLGLRLPREGGGYDVRVNLDKDAAYVFAEADCAIVLAED